MTLQLPCYKWGAFLKEKQQQQQHPNMKIKSQQKKINKAIKVQGECSVSVSVSGRLR